MTRPKPCVDHLGQHYPSEAARARAYGLSDTAVRVRLAAGETLEAALTRPRRDRGPGAGVPTTWDGVTYPSRIAAAQAAGMSEGRFYHHFQRPRPRYASPLRWWRIARVLDAWRASRNAAG